MSFFEKCMSFDKFITPSIIKIIYIVMLVLVELLGIGIILGGIFGRGQGVMVLMGIAYMLVGPLFVRIYAEMIILFFKMYEKLCDISGKLGSDKSCCDKASECSTDE